MTAKMFKLLKILLTLTILTAPLYDLVRWEYFGWYPTTLLELLIWLTLGVWLVDKLRRHNFSWPRTRFDGPILLLLIAGVISVLISPDQFAALGRWRAFFLEPILVFYLLVDLAQDHSLEKLVTRMILLAAGWLSILGILQFFFDFAIITPDQFNRAHAVYNNGNHLAHFLGPVILLAVARKQWRWSLLLLPAFVATKSLGGYIALTVGLTTLVARQFLSEKTFSRLLRGGVILGVATFIIFLTQIHHLTPEVENPWVRPGGTATVRLCLWEGTWELLKDRPVFGAGLAGFQDLYSTTYYTCDAEPFADADNILLNFWTKTGILGLIGLVWLLLLIFQSPSSICYLPFLYWFSHGLVDVPYFKNDISLLWWVFLALLVSSQQLSRRRPHSQPHPSQQP